MVIKRQNVNTEQKVRVNRMLNIQVLFVQEQNVSYQIACAPNENSDKPRHPRRLSRLFAVSVKTLWIIGYPHNALQYL